MTRETHNNQGNFGKIYLIGNPNTGKTTLFNNLTGLNQKTGNYPGVTVEKKTGYIKLPGGHQIEIVDLPGIYNINGFSPEEKIVRKELENASSDDLILIVVDASYLYKGLIIATQIIDLGKPCALVINMMDILERSQAGIDLKLLSKLLNGVPVFPLNARINKGTGKIIEFLNSPDNFKNYKPVLHKDVIGENADLFTKRVEKVRNIVSQVLIQPGELKDTLITRKIDNILTHPVWGVLIFLFVLFLIFQSIFTLAEAPMEWIEYGFATLSGLIENILPDGVLRNLLIDGVMAGLSGIAVFLPQIVMLFLFIGILEEIGYMSRISFLMDRIFRPFGLNGKAIIPLMGGMACAVPSIMGTRLIENTRERLITIFIIPLISCSARLPIYTLLISLLQEQNTSTVLNTKGVLLFGIYLLGFISALILAKILSITFNNKQPSGFVMEMPLYKTPQWRNIFTDVWIKSRSFLFDAGKIIMAFSIIIWTLSAYGPSDDLLPQKKNHIDHSYLGIMGKKIEPALRPLGYDWKIGVGILSSFAAREIFVGTVSTLYSVDQSENSYLLKEKLKAARHEDGSAVFTLPAIISLLIFYAYAMQCMATIAIVKKETNSWRWPLLQFLLFTSIAYFAALISYQLMT
ncbi:MAG: ferrous iron transport protein B [Vicingaceae bacterium]|nr:MAG: ferrous iron transport protein B [Vicingaceae bacterium]